MSDFTTQLRFICESYAKRYDKPQPQANVDSIIEAARTNIFDFDYPIFDVNYKKTLEEKIISHYYTREIGQETVGLFKLRLKNKMREIMPYYNQLYLSEKLKFNPFFNTDAVDTRETASKDERTNESLSFGNAQGVQSTESNQHTDNTTDSAYSDYERSASDGSGSENYSGSGHADVKAETSGTDDTTKSGKENTKPAGTTTLNKHSDAPLGSVGNITGDDSNYLSDATETVVSINASGELSFTNRKDAREFSSDEKRAEDTADAHRSDTNTSNSLEDVKTGSGSNQSTTDTTGAIDVTHSDSNTENRSGKEQGEASSDYFGRLFGKTGSETYSEMLNKFRSTFLNIDLDVINELNDLFMLVW